MRRLQSIVESAGAQWVGVQCSLNGDLVLFNDPVTKTTLALLWSGLTLPAIAEKIRMSRFAFGYAL